MDLKLVGFSRTNMLTVGQMFGALGIIKPWEDQAL